MSQKLLRKQTRRLRLRKCGGWELGFVHCKLNRKYFIQKFKPLHCTKCNGVVEYHSQNKNTKKKRKTKNIKNNKKFHNTLYLILTLHKC